MQYYNLTEVIVDTGFGHTSGEAFSLALLLSNPIIDVKLIVLTSQDPKREFPLLLRFLSSMRREDIPVALGEGDGSYSLSGLAYEGRVFASAFEAYASLLPRMKRPEILCLGAVASLQAARPFLFQCHATLLLSSFASKEAFTKKDFAFDPRVDVISVSKEVEKKVYFSEEETNKILASNSLTAQALHEYLSLPDIDSTFGEVASAYALSFPQNFDFSLDEVEGSEITFAGSFHKSQAMKEVSMNLLVQNGGRQKDLQVVEQKGRFRISYPSLEASESLYVYETGWEKHRPGDHYGPTQRDVYFLHLVLQGKGTMEIEKEEIPIKEGDLFIIPAGLTTRIEADPADPYEYFWVGFGGKDASRLVESCGFSKGNGYSVKPLDFESLRVEFRLLASVQSRGPGTSYWLLGHLYLILSMLAFERPSQNPGKKNYVKEGIAYMNENFASGIKVSDVAKHIAVDRTYFFRRFKEEIGMSPQDYLVSLRVEKAKEYLRSTAKPIATIGYLVGYPNYISFLKIFAKKTGMSPSEFRGKKEKLS